MAISWFYKLKRKKKSKCKSQAATGTTTSCKPRSQPPKPPPYSPNRASYYFPTRDRPERLHSDTAVGIDVADRRADLDVLRATPELKLRPIVTRPAAKNEPSDGGSTSTSTTASVATSPASRRRFHVKQGGRRRRGGGGDRKAKAVAALQEERRRRWLYESVVVVKASEDPEWELAESMAEMVVANDIRSSEDLEELLACYLALNAAEHHRAVVAAFRRVWFHLARQRLHD